MRLHNTCLAAWNLFKQATLLQFSRPTWFRQFPQAILTEHARFLSRGAGIFKLYAGIRISGHSLSLPILMLVSANVVVNAATTEVFRYSDAHGRSVFTDRAINAPQYRLVWRTTLSKLDSAFQHAPHLPVMVTSSSRSKVWHRRSEFAPLIQKVAREVKINAHLLHAVVQAESAYNPQAHSPAGAMGLMQLMPATAKRYGVTDIMDPEQNITGGAEYLRDLLELFDNNLRLVLAAYNAGEGAVLRNGNQIPPYPETREYVRRVIANFRSQRGQFDSG